MPSSNEHTSALNMPIRNTAAARRSQQRAKVTPYAPVEVALPTSAAAQLPQRHAAKELRPVSKYWLAKPGWVGT